jgi:hypothetical protein
MTTETTTPQGEVATGYTEDQAASEMLKRWAGKEEKPEPSTEAETTETTETTETEEVTTEATETTEETQAEESGDIEIDVAGEKFKLPATLKELGEKVQAKAKEVEAGATRKFQEAADLRKAAEARAEQVERMQKIAHAQAELLADHRFVMKRLAAYEQIDINALSQNDPAALTRINAEYNQLTAARQRLEQAYQKAVGDYDTETKQAKQARLQSLQEYASKNIKGWGNEADRSLNEYLGGKGIERETMLSFLEQEPKLLTILEEALYGMKVRTAKPEKALPKPTTLKPGTSGQTKTNAQQTADTAKRRLAQTGHVDDAAKVLLARLNTRK